MDIYFDENYGKLYEAAELGKQEIFEFSCQYGAVRHQFIKRPIDERYYDLITPYGYGGPVIVSTTNKEKLVAAFEEAFCRYCADNRIVSEFVRFHPIINNGPDFATVYKSERIRHTVGTNLKDYPDPVAEEFSKSCRKNIRQAMNKGVTFRITEEPDSLDSFIKVYYDTMDRNAASEYYYFDHTYFDSCLRLFKKNIVLVEAFFDDQIIAAGLYFVYNGIVHIHLSGTYSQYLHLSPAYILRYAVTLWAKEHNCTLVHHGGGRSNSEDDPLYKFKKQFGKNTQFDFYVGKKVWDQEAYDRLCSDNNVSPDITFFPTYRSK